MYGSRGKRKDNNTSGCRRRKRVEQACACAAATPVRPRACCRFAADHALAGLSLRLLVKVVRYKVPRYQDTSYFGRTGGSPTVVGRAPARQATQGFGSHTMGAAVPQARVRLAGGARRLRLCGLPRRAGGLRCCRGSPMWADYGSHRMQGGDGGCLRDACSQSCRLVDPQRWILRPYPPRLAASGAPPFGPLHLRAPVGEGGYVPRCPIGRE